MTFDWGPYLQGYTPADLLQSSLAAVAVFAPLILLRMNMRVVSDAIRLVYQAVGK